MSTFVFLCLVAASPVFGSPKADRKAASEAAASDTTQSVALADMNPCPDRHTTVAYNEANATVAFLSAACFDVTERAAKPLKACSQDLPGTIKPEEATCGRLETETRAMTTWVEANAGLVSAACRRDALCAGALFPSSQPPTPRP